MNNNSNNFGTLAAAFLGGAAAGAAFAYLTAPKSGRELRSDWRQYAEQKGSDVRGYVEDHTRGVARLPEAAKAATGAAKEAFASSMAPSQSDAELPKANTLGTGRA